MKKFWMLLACIGLACVTAVGFAACSGGAQKIVVVSRESGSGTRSGFEEALGLKEEDVKVASIQSSTNNVMTSVANNKQAIGYISYGSLNDTVKALQLNGVTCTMETVLNGSYEIQRPFVLVYDKERTLSSLEQDFVTFLNSSQAQKVIADNKFVSSKSDAPQYVSPGGLAGELKFVGSTSVNPLIEKLFAAYEALNKGVTMTSTANGSGAGITSAQTDAVFGMSSRELKTEEAESLSRVNVCVDAIAVIVNKNNALNNVSKENLKKIYTGEIVKFEDVL